MSWAFQLSFTQAETLEGGSDQSQATGPLLLLELPPPDELELLECPPLEELVEPDELELLEWPPLEELVEPDELDEVDEPEPEELDVELELPPPELEVLPPELEPPELLHPCAENRAVMTLSPSNSR